VEVFNLDLHIAVIADVASVLERRGIGVTSWSISGHTWVFDREREAVAVVNETTAGGFNPRMVKRFRRVYGRYLRSFDGFVATYPPCFSLLYEGLPGPTVAVCATRYEWPLTFDRRGWAWLDDALRRGIDDGWLYLVANNRADAGYAENYLGLEIPVIPGGCSYLAHAYTGRRRSVVVSAKYEPVASAICDELSSDAIPLRTALGKRYSWADLYDHRAIVLIPYNVSLMSLFEHYAACIPIYVPERSFLKRLMQEHPEAVLSQLSFAQLSTNDAQPANTAVRDLNDIRDPEVVDWYLDRADFYDESWMPSIRRFESWSHLDHLLRTDDPLEISHQMASEQESRSARIAELWETHGWLSRVGASRR
jgi:hypothetical protein